MEQMGAIARCLADDVLLTTIGANALHIFEQAFQATLWHMTHLGAQIAANKSKLFSTSLKYKSWLAARLWNATDTTIPVTNSMRDVGSELSFGSQYATTMSQARLASAIQTIGKIKRLPHDLDQINSFVRQTAHTKGLYSTEASHVDEHKLGPYTSAIVSLLSPNTFKANNAMVFIAHSSKGDIDPSVALYMSGN